MIVIKYRYNIHMYTNKKLDSADNINNTEFIEFIDSELKTKMKQKCGIVGNVDDDIMNNRDFYISKPLIFELLNKIENAKDKIKVFNNFSDEEKCLFFGLEINRENIKVIQKLTEPIKNNLINHQIQLLKRVQIKLNDNDYKTQITCMNNTYHKIIKSLKQYIDFNKKAFTQAMYQDILNNIVTPVIQTELYGEGKKGAGKLKTNKRGRGRNKKTTLRGKYIKNKKTTKLRKH
jgi:hypothetical protein